MDVRFSLQEGLDISIYPKESDGLALVMQLTWEEEKQRGTPVPTFEPDFFKKLAVTKENFPIKFDFEHLEFACVFLEEVCIEMEENDMDTTKLDEFLDYIHEFCSMDETLQ